MHGQRDGHEQLGWLVQIHAHAGVDGDGAGERLGRAPADHAAGHQAVAEVLGGSGQLVVGRQAVALEGGAAQLGAQRGDGGVVAGRQRGARLNRKLQSIR